jgi:molecular chaperone GrpE
MNSPRSHSGPDSEPTPDTPDTPDTGAEPAVPADAAAQAAGEPAAEAQAMRDRWLRAEAELQNFRRRAQRDVDEARRTAEDRVLLGVIECLDDLDRAIASARAEADPAWLQGVELVAQRMRDVLARHGVTPVEAEGEPFDPHVHEALIQVPASESASPGTVASVVRAGWRRGDRVLRPARVAVAAELPASG